MCNDSSNFNAWIRFEHFGGIVGSSFIDILVKVDIYVSLNYDHYYVPKNCSNGVVLLLAASYPHLNDECGAG